MKKVAHEQQQKQTFVRELGALSETLEARGIDYRIIGSVGAAALLGSKLNFNRPGALVPHQHMPDIDVIVPRASLGEMREIRDEMIQRGGPKIGLANATGEIDFLPERDESFLTHGDASIPVTNEVLQETWGELEGVSFKTLPLDALLQTYGTFGGAVRTKDMPTIRSMIEGSDPEGRSRMQAFYDFRNYRRHHSPHEKYIAGAMEKLGKHPLIKNAIGLAAIKAADILGRR